MNDILSKINTIMYWESFNNETPEQVFIRECNDLSALPDKQIIDVVYAGGLDMYAEQCDVETQEQLKEKLIKICNLAIATPVFRNKKKQDMFPPLFNFFTFCNNAQKNGKLNEKVSGIAENAFLNAIAPKKLNEKLKSIFDVEVSIEKYLTISTELKTIWNLSDKDVDFLRYFVCQCRNADQNPSLNKSLYIFSEQKQTGKTTFARAFASVLNGDEFQNAGRYESSYGIENQFNSHDLPRACIYNCIILDEAMPTDTKKSYGTLKTMLTNSNVNFNPKFRSLINLKARRNYIFTSNNSIEKYIQDDSERRFYQITFLNKPVQISFEKIYEIVKSFCQQCTPREDLSIQEWYDSFEHVDGLGTIELNEIFIEFLTKKDDLFFVENGYVVTPWSIATKLYTKNCTREQKDIIKKAMHLYFASCTIGNGKQERYSIVKIRKVLETFENSNGGITIVDQLPDINPDELPF